MATVFDSWESYFIPGTSTLKNKFTSPEDPHGEPDPAKLSKLELN